MAKKQITFQSSRDVRLYLASLLVRVEKDEIDRKKAEILSNIAYKIQTSISGELKERELAQAEELARQIEMGRK
ncbi:hypothetical protein [Ureibacillus thermosphaericus]|uniref:Uncharacterized protein n=1 Tax=Ureibacillus thermosphaericus TaxID=51173 RepID=A0A840Q5P1_URETH|nr:hypothetical protein [Ureibacillus thermosphaericus]MBB5150276.1 hypothetical protein [Ureibacillus thermosphaericus]NKZ32887.1 hypothetical protein [Ureibacillus thermosphaericus]